MSEANKLLGKGIHKIHVAEIEADIYEVFFHAYQQNTDLLIRAGITGNFQMAVITGPYWGTNGSGYRAVRYTG